MTAAAKRCEMATRSDRRLEVGGRIFTRVLVGIDGSQEGLEAARQGAILPDVEGDLTLLAVWDIAPIIGGTGSEIPPYLNEELQRKTAEEALVAARAYVAPYTDATTGKLVRGTPVSELLTEIERSQATLVVVGSHGTGRLRGIVVGSVATAIIHKAPCSVLVARPAKDGFPRRVVVGVDGSVESAAAYAAAHYLTRRFSAELRTIVAWGGKRLNESLVAAITDGIHEDSSETPIEALSAASAIADLVVIGNRGHHGLGTLGSVSERIAHTAPCSVLVVREPIWQRIAEELGR